MNTVLILICPCATQSKSAMFRCFFFLLYFTTSFGLTGHHQVYKICSRSLLCFPSDVPDASRRFSKVMLRHVFESNHVFGSSVICTRLYSYYGIENDASNNSSTVGCVLVATVTFLPSRYLATIATYRQTD
jgi:hypothetical protein